MTAIGSTDLFAIFEGSRRVRPGARSGIQETAAGGRPCESGDWLGQAPGLGS